MNICGVQFDSVSPLPFRPALEARYVNGRYSSPPEYGRGRVYIDVNGSNPRGAFWLDVEKGDATPAAVPSWLDERITAEGAGGIYCSRNSLAAVEAAAGNRPHLLWVATLDGTMEITPPPGIGVLAVVQAIPASMLGFNADLSLVIDTGYWAARHA